MRKRHLAAVATLFISAGSLASPVTARAATPSTFYVNNAVLNCSDSTTDSATTPFCTIQAAVDQATSPGDTVVVAYFGAVTYALFEVTASGTAAAPITIESSNGDRLTSSAATAMVGLLDQPGRHRERRVLRGHRGLSA